MSRLLPSFDPDKCTLFALGRNAMYTACKSLDLKKGDLILTPAVDCDSTLTPFRVLGLTFEFYKSNPYTYSVDLKDIKKRITPQVKLIHIINHFGVPQPWDSILKLRNETNIPILEDNAFSLFSTYNSKPFGSFGDFSIFSLYKLLPIIDGGMLRINNPEYVLDPLNEIPKWFYPQEKKKVISLVTSTLGYNYLPDFVKSRLSPVKKTLPPMFSDKPGYPNWRQRDSISESFACNFSRPMSKIARIQLEKFLVKDYSTLKKKIRYYYTFIIENLKGINGIKILWPQIPEGVVPSCVSILIESNRDNILYKLREKRYGVIAWPTYSSDVIDRSKEYPEIEIIGRKVLQILIPVHRVLISNSDMYFKNLVIELKKNIKQY